MQTQTPQRPYHIGLALSGGGARGFAHVGAYKALTEAGIYPDIISGTSAGAIIGAMIADGHTADEIMDFFKERKLRDLAHPAMTRTGFMNLNGLERRLTDFLHAHHLESLKTPLVITATDINLGIPVHWKSGELMPRVLASSCVPIVFSPVLIDEHQHVDGGVFMNLPVRPIRKDCDIVIGVHIDPVEPKAHVKNMMQLAERTFHMSILSNMNIDTKLCDILIAPAHIDQYNMFDLGNMQKVFDLGYQTARHVLSQPATRRLLGI